MADILTDYQRVERPERSEGQSEAWKAFHANMRARSGGTFTQTGYGNIQQINERGQLENKLFKSEDETSDAESPRAIQGYGTLVERELLNQSEANPSMGIYYSTGAFSVSEEYSPELFKVQELPARFRKNRVVKKRRIKMRRHERVLVQDRTQRKNNRDVVVTD